MSRLLYEGLLFQRIKHLEESTRVAAQPDMRWTDRRRVWVIAAAAFFAWAALSIWSEADVQRVAEACRAASREVNGILDCGSSNEMVAAFFALFAMIAFAVGWSCARFLRARHWVYSALIACVGGAVCLFAGMLWTFVVFEQAWKHWDVGLRDRLPALPSVCLLAAVISLLGTFVRRRSGPGKTAT